jgi:hypothetical protein
VHTAKEKDWREAEVDWIDRIAGARRKSSIVVAPEPEPEPEPAPVYAPPPRRRNQPDPARDAPDDWFSRQNQKAPAAYTSASTYSQKSAYASSYRNEATASSYQSPAKTYEPRDESPPTPDHTSYRGGGGGADWREAEDDWMAQQGGIKPAPAISAPSPTPSEDREQDRLRRERQRQERTAGRRMSIGLADVSGLLVAAGAAAEDHVPIGSPSKREAAAREEARQRELARQATEAFNSIPGTSIPIDKQHGEHWKTTLILKKAREAAAVEREQAVLHIQAESKWKGIPEWKRRLLEKRKADEEEYTRPEREAEERQRMEEERFYSMPAWKQKLILQAQNQ